MEHPRMMQLGAHFTASACRCSHPVRQF